MVYHEKLVAVVKCGGRVLRERNESVILPFGAEYSVLLKNLETSRALVHVEIDGQTVTEGGLILEPNTSLELEGFLSGSRVTNRFKFIQKTEQIQNHRGDRVDDGIIRIRYSFEQTLTCTWSVRPSPWYTLPHTHWPVQGQWTDDSSHLPCNRDTIISCYAASPDLSTGVFCSNVSSQATPLLDEGITVHGSESAQAFRPAFFGVSGPEHSIVLKLRGTQDSGAAVQTPVTVKNKLECPTCGTKNTSNMKFCGQCGTALF